MVMVTINEKPSRPVAIGHAVYLYPTVRPGARSKYLRSTVPKSEREKIRDGENCNHSAGRKQSGPITIFVLLSFSFWACLDHSGLSFLADSHLS
jgi:hypothetical protein